MPGVAVRGYKRGGAYGVVVPVGWVAAATPSIVAKGLVECAIALAQGVGLWCASGVFVHCVFCFVYCVAKIELFLHSCKINAASGGACCIVAIKFRITATNY